LTEEDEEDSAESALSLCDPSAVSAGPYEAVAGLYGALVLQMELVAAPSLQAVLAVEMAARSHAAQAQGGCKPTAAPALQRQTAVPAATEVRWRWVAGIARGLNHLHAFGWVHNDVKPANVLCSADGHAKLCDLGLASNTAATAKVTQITVAPAGTAMYMAPERCVIVDGKGSADSIPGTCAAAVTSAIQRSASTSAGSGPIQAQPPSAPPSDVYSLGVLLAEVHSHFATAMERAVVLSSVKHQAGARTSLSHRQPHNKTTVGCVCKVADRLVRAMLARQPNERPTAAEVERDASACAHSDKRAVAL